jgi:integrase
MAPRPLNAKNWALPCSQRDAPAARQPRRRSQENKSIAEQKSRKRYATGKRTPGIFYRLDRRGERAYEITWRDSGGKQHWQRVLGNLKDAQDALATKRAERNRSQLLVSSKTFAEVLEEYKRSEHFTDLRASTQATYSRALDNYVRPTFDHVKVSEITTRAVADWLKSLRTIDRQRGRGNLSAWTRRGALTTLRVVLRFAADEGYVQANPVDSLSRRQVPEPDEREVRVLDGKEVGRLLEHAPERSRLMLTVKAFTGLRSSELRGLIWTDLDLESGKLTVQRQIDSEDRGERVALKTPAARRTLPLRPQDVHALRDQYAARAEWTDTEGFVFQRDGRRVAHGQLADDFATAVKAAGIDDHGKRLTPHSLRHGYGSMLIAAGRDVVRVSRRMGHASVAITLRVYSHEFESHRPEDDERDLEALESFAPTNG